ncbi:hypothetical protein FHG87_018576 [Trinorchestia longiramus]|nr:hypothetical protein FHG87_018576 [Trinorchestia longiramus]
MIVVTLISWLLIGCLVVTSQSTDPDNRWVWRSLRSPSTTLELPLNPFQPFPSSSEEARQEDPHDDSSSPVVVLPTRNQENVISQRGNPEGAFLSSFSPDQTTPSVPNVNLNLATNGRSRNPSFLTDSRRVVQQNLGIAHFTIPRQLGRPVTVTTPTSNHLPAENELLVSSYSSLDAEVTGLNELKSSKNRNRGRNLINPPVRKGPGSITIKPLPIDISKLPLESTERAEGIKKLWSSLTSRTEFAQIFEALAGKRRNSSSERRERNPNTEAENSSILLDPHNSISESVIRVINPPQIQLQQQILKQQLRQQELQQRLQEQFEAEIQQQELKKRLEIQKLVREQEEQQRIAIQQNIAQEQQLEQEQLLRQQQQLQTGDDRKKLTDDEHLSDELQDLVDPDDILRRRHERLVERLLRKKEAHPEQHRTRQEIQERRRRLHELQQQQRLQQLRQRLQTEVLSTTSPTIAAQATSTEPSENDVAEEIPQRSTIVFPPRLPIPSRSLSLPNRDFNGANNEHISNIASTTTILSGSSSENNGTNNDDVTTSGSRGVRTANAGAINTGSGTSGTVFSGTTATDVSSSGGTNTAGRWLDVGVVTVTGRPN